LPAMIAAKAKPGDLVVCLGAGSITYWANALAEDLETIAPAKAGLKKPATVKITKGKGK